MLNKGIRKNLLRSRLSIESTQIRGFGFYVAQDYNKEFKERIEA